MKGFKADEAERQYLTIEEVKKMAETECRYPHLKRAFLFGCFTGLRKSDIEKLTWGEVQKFGDYTRLVFKQKKTGGQEYLDIPKAAEQYLGKQGSKGPDELVFPMFKYSAETSLELRRWALAAGITKDFTCCRYYEGFHVPLQPPHLRRDALELGNRHLHRVEASRAPGDRHDADIRPSGRFQEAGGRGQDL